MSDFRVSVHPVRPSGVLLRWAVRASRRGLWSSLGSLTMSREEWAQLKPRLAGYEIVEGTPLWSGQRRAA